MPAPALASVTIYTTRLCGYCVVAKRLLTQKGVAFTEVHADDRADLRDWLIDTTGRNTVPQIFLNGASVGGYDDMAALEKRGKLDTLLQTAPPTELSALPS